MTDTSWRPDAVLRLLLLWWISLTFLTGWLPVVRGAFDGPTYEWGTSYFGASFSGAGVGGDYWLPVVKTALGVTLLVLGWRGARSPFPSLLVAVQGLGLADALYSAITAPDDFRFRGDTLGVDVSLAWVAPTLYAAAFVLSVVWFVKRRHTRLDRDPGWSPRNTRWLAALLALLPIQLALLRWGPPGSTADQAGVLITIAQWFLFPVAIRVKPPVEARAAVAGRPAARRVG